MHEFQMNIGYPYQHAILLQSRNKIFKEFLYKYGQSKLNPNKVVHSINNHIPMQTKESDYK